MKAGILRFGLVGCVVGSVAYAQQGQAPPYDYQDLTRLADKYGTDKGTKSPRVATAQPHNYTEVYEYFFQPMRNETTKVCEIGVGPSTLMFKDYFPKATIYGIDIQDHRRTLESPRSKMFVADQANRQQLQKVLDVSGSNFDLIVDDGGHSMEQQQVSFGYFFEHVKPGGYYVIEDLHTSLMDGYGVDPDKKNTTLGMIENFVRTGSIVSKYMTPAEAQYATAHIRYCNLLKGADLHSITCLLKKK